jgi:hypothetical protein
LKVGFASGLGLRSSSYDPTGRSIFFIKIDRIHYFDIRHSTFVIRYSLFYPRRYADHSGAVYFIS